MDGLSEPYNVFTVTATRVVLPASFLYRGLHLVGFSRWKDKDQGKYWASQQGEHVGIIK